MKENKQGTANIFAVKPARPRLLLALALLAVPVPSYAQVACVPLPALVQRCPVWTGTFGSAASVHDFPSDAVVSTDGKVVYTWGVTSATQTGLDGTIVARDASSGAQRWVATQQGSGSVADLAGGLALSPDSDRVYLGATRCETASATETCDLIVTAFDAGSGEMAWETSLDGPAAGYDSATDVIASADGSVLYVSGVLSRPGTHADAALVALDAATGDVLWSSAYDGNRRFDSALAVALSTRGDLVHITGLSDGTGTGRDFVTATFDAANGERVWATRRDDHGADDLVTAMAVTEGRVIVTGSTASGADLTGAYVTAAYDAESGTELWATKYDVGVIDTPLDVSVGPGGTAVYVTGMSRGNTGGYDMATAAYDVADGRELWTARFNGPANNGDAAWAVEADPNDDLVYIAGDTVVPNVDYFHAVIAYDTADGSTEWTTLHRGAGSQNGSLRSGLAMAPDGARVYYAGQVLSESGDTDFLTLAYDAS